MKMMRIFISNIGNPKIHLRMVNQEKIEGFDLFG